MATDLKLMTFAAAKDHVKNKLQTNPEWLVRGLMCLYSRQTADEQSAEVTDQRNSKGFNSSDAEILTGFAKQWKAREWFSDKQMAILRRKMSKYAGQLTRVARGEEEPAQIA